MSLSDANLNTGANEIVKMLDSGAANQAVDRLRSDALEMNPQDFLKLIKEIREREQNEKNNGQIFPKGADLQLISHADGRTTVCVNDNAGVVQAVASQKDGKITDTYVNAVPDKGRNASIEQSDIPKLPNLDDNQKKVLQMFEDSIKNHDPAKISELLTSYRGKAGDLNPIMECLSADLKKKGIEMSYGHGEMALGGEDLKDTGFLKVWNQDGGNVLEFSGHKDIKPIDYGTVSKENDGALSYFGIWNYQKLDNVKRMPNDVQADLNLLSKKME